jgi:hypothetical protein
MNPRREFVVTTFVDVEADVQEVAAALRALDAPPPASPHLRYAPRIDISALECRWQGGRGVPGWLDGERFLVAYPRGPGRARLVHGEIFRGIRVAWMRLAFTGETHAQLAAAAAALKARAEGAQGDAR